MAANPWSFILVPTASRGMTAPISQASDAVTFLPSERSPEKKKEKKRFFGPCMPETKRYPERTTQVLVPCNNLGNLPLGKGEDRSIGNGLGG